MEILTNDLAIPKSIKEYLCSILGEMVSDYFQNSDNMNAYEERKCELTKELDILRARRAEKQGINLLKED